MNNIFLKPAEIYTSSNQETSAAGTVLLILKGIIGLLLILATSYCYYHYFWAFPRTSDTALGFLWGNDIVSGNLLLKNWVLPWDNYFTLDALLYVLGIKLIGPDPRLMYLLPALIYSMIVWSSLYFIYIYSNENKKSVSILMGLFWFTFPSFTAMGHFAQIPLHIVTTLYVLLTFWLLSNLNRSWRCYLAFLLLLLANIGDALSYFIGNLTFIIAAFAIASLPKKEKKMWIAVAILSALASVVIKKLIFLYGFQPSLMMRPAFVDFDFIIRNFIIDFHGILLFFNADIFGQPIHSIITAQHLYHLFLFALGVWVTFIFLKQLRYFDHHHIPQRSFLSFLVIANLINFSACVFSNMTDSPGSIERLCPNFVFFAIFSAILIPTLFKKLKAVHSSLILILLILLNALIFRHEFQEKPRMSLSPTSVEQFLMDHHLTQGYGNYWSASMYTARTAGNIKVRPVRINENGVLAPIETNTNKLWYQQSSNFLILENSDWGNIERDTAAAIKTFGPPQQIVSVDQNRILLWDHNIQPQLPKNHLNF